jgi:putative ABC transport system permease protein
MIDGEVRSLRLFGHVRGGLGTPTPFEGRVAGASGEVVVDSRLDLDLGDTLTLGDSPLRVVGRVRGHSLLGGIPNVYAPIDDAQEIVFDGGDLITAVVTVGVPRDPVVGFTVLTPGDVERDTVHAMGDAISSIDNSRSLMWIVAAVIVAALMYVSALERLRDFAVLKSLGSSSLLLFAGIAMQAVVVALVAGAVAIGAARVLRPMFALPTAIPASAYLVLPVVAILVGLLSSLVALRRAVSVDPAAALS